jgi:phage tail sheath protein FI
MSMNLGINLVEVNGATPSIQGAPTSVAGFVIRSQRGVPGIVRGISSFAQFTDYFGGYVATGNNDPGTPNGTQTSYVGAYAVRGFFDNGGSLAYVYRVVDQSATTAANAASAAFPLVSGSGTTALTLTAAFRGQADPGSWANNIAISIVSNTSNPSVTDAFDVIVALVTLVKGAATYKILETWAKLSISGAPGYQQPQVLNDPNTGSKYVSCATGSFPVWAASTAYGLGAHVIHGGNVYVVTTAGSSAASGGPTGTTASITDNTVTWAYVPPRLTPAWQASHAYAVGQYASNGANLYVVTTAGTSAATDGPTGTAASITDGTVVWAPVTLPTYTRLADGAEDSLATGAGGSLDTALAAVFTTPSPFDPYSIALLACPETAATSVVQSALTYCQNRGDCVFVGHVPDGGQQPLAAAKAYGQSLQGDRVYGAVYMPFIQVVDPVGSLIWIPPTGHVLGVYARTDQQRGIWKAPAGDAARVNNALNVRAMLNDTDFTDLVKNGSVNAIRSITGAGIVIDSSRTLSTNTLWLYVNVRLLFNFVKTSLRLGLRWVVQEPNDTTLWNKIKFNSVTPFLMGLWRRGAFGPGAPADVFTVKVDAVNNPPANIQQGILNVEVYFYPSRPAETIVITVGQQEGAATASEG